MNNSQSAAVETTSPKANPLRPISNQRCATNTTPFAWLLTCLLAQFSYYTGMYVAYVVCAISSYSYPRPAVLNVFYLPCTWLGPNYMSESKFCEHIPCCVVSAVSLVAISCLIQAANKTTQTGKRYAIWFFNLILGWILHTSLPATARVGHGPWPWLLVLSL